LDTIIQLLVLGLSSGAIYVGLALGLLIIYRSSGVINFAQGAMAMWGAYVYASLRTSGTLVLPIGQIQLAQQGVPVWLSLLISLLTSAVVGYLAHLLVFRQLRRAPALVQLVASVALMVTVQSLAELRFGSNAVIVLPILPTGTVSIGSASLAIGDLLLAGLAIVIALATWAYFRFTTLGLASRAFSMNERGVALMGFSPNRLAAASWTLGVLVSGGLMLLGSPATGLDAVNIPLLVVPALAVLLVARMSSAALVAVGGLILGPFQALMTYLSAEPWWPTWAQAGIQDAVPFLVVVATLYISGGKLPSRGGLDEDTKLPDVRLPNLRPVSLAVPLVIAVAAIQLTSGSYRFGVVTSLAMALLALSYVVTTGYLGQVSLAQVSFAGAAGFVLSKASVVWHLPFPVAPLISVIFAGVLGLIVGVPALRIRGIQLAIVTLAAAVTIQNFVFANPALIPLNGLLVPNASLPGINLAAQVGRSLARLPFAYMTLIVTAAFFAVFIWVARGRLGRAFLAVRSNERAAASSGVNVRSVKLVGFCLSAFMAGGAGVLIAYSQGQLAEGSFTISTGLLILATAYLGGITSVNGALIAGLLSPLGIVYVVLNNDFNFGQYYNLIAGLGLVLTAMFNPEGISGRTYSQYRWVMSKIMLRQAAPAGEATASKKMEAGATKS
jgi:branched-chain amino acid transport system permease protein